MGWKNTSKKMGCMGVSIFSFFVCAGLGTAFNLAHNEVGSPSYKQACVLSVLGALVGAAALQAWGRKMIKNDPDDLL